MKRISDDELSVSFKEAEYIISTLDPNIYYYGTLEEVIAKFEITELSGKTFLFCGYDEYGICQYIPITYRDNVITNINYILRKILNKVIRTK